MSIINNMCLILAFFLFFSFNTHLSLGTDTISANRPLSGDQTIVSSGGNFELGFNKPGNTSSYYICMWYKKVSTITIVWVANRESPVSNKFFSVLKISDGNLVLFNESQTPVWSTNQNSTTSNSIFSVLRDDGNLVLLDGPNSTQPVWQSFDFPTHTWLPGGKLAYNKRTKTHQCLTSWKNLEDPSPGLFSYSLDTNSSEYFLWWNGTTQYWTSGPWNGHIFSLIPEMRTDYIFNFSYVDNENESYFTYSLYDSSIISRFIMDFSGQVKQLTWLEPTKEWNLLWSQPRQECEVYALCGAFGTCNSISQPFCDCLTGFQPKSDKEWKLSDYSRGCVRRTQLRCGKSSSTTTNQEREKFMEYPNIKFPINAQPVDVGSVPYCETLCLNNRSCTAYAYESNQCSIWIGELVNLEQLSGNDGSGKTLYLKLAASEFPSSKKNKGITIGAVTGSVLLAILCFALVYIWRRQRMLAGETETAEGSLITFTYKYLQNGTKNFSEKLGGGGFGSVFKGTLPDLTVIAVKKLEGVSQGEKQFRMEVSTIGAVQHINLVRLRGFCSEGNKRLLVYDYMQNGSLDSHIFCEKDEQVLDWKTRYEIALGMARGLAYLHEKSRNYIIHCDIKPENVLLDSEFCPKVADFGLAKLVGREFSRVLTSIRGTRGYLAPEWISGVPITTKADVYSFGMMLFEIISGRRNSGHFENGKYKYFPIWAAIVVVEGGDILSLLDHRLDRSVDAEEVTRICRIACWCIQDDESHRPTMGQIVQILEGVMDVNPAPVPPSLLAFVDD